MNHWQHICNKIQISIFSLCVVEWTIERASVRAWNELQDHKRSFIANDELFFYHAVLEQWAHRLAQCVFVCKKIIKEIGKHEEAQR